LADPAFRSAAPSTAVKPAPSLLELAWQWIVDHILRPLLHPIARALAASHGVGTVIGIVLVLVSLALLAFVAFRVALAFVGPVVASAGRGRGLGAVPSAADAAYWRAAAREAAARGAYAEAIAALFRAALAELDERAIVAFDAARTPGEYRRAVRRVRSAAAAPFDELADRFVRAAFAQETPQRAEFDAAERALSALEPALTP
jgi:hypothetical protein